MLPIRCIQPPWRNMEVKNGNAIAVNGTLDCDHVTTSAGTTGVNMFVFVLSGSANSELDKATATTFSTDHVTLSDIQAKIAGGVMAVTGCQINARTWSVAWSGSETVTKNKDVNSVTGNTKIGVFHFASTANGTTDDLTLTMSSTSSLFAAGGAAISFGP